MEILYCIHCHKSYSVRLEDIRLMQSNGKNVEETPRGYRFDAGCFFKELAALKRSLVKNGENGGR